MTGAHVFHDTVRARNQLVRHHSTLVLMANPEKFAAMVLDVIAPFEGEKPIRRHLRQYFPAGYEGYVVEDVDLVTRRWGPRYGFDAIGKFRLIEFKWRPNAERGAPLGKAQRLTFEPFDQLFRSAPDPHRRYEGFYVVTHRNPNPVDGRIWIQGIDRDGPAPEVSPSDFDRWMGGKVPVDPRTYPTWEGYP